MKIILQLTLFIFTSAILGDKSLSLTNYEIIKICKNVENKSSCRKDLQNKKSNLQKGDHIEIPVIPYKR